MQKTWGFIFVLIAGVGFGFLGIFGKLAFQSGISVGELLTARFFLASVILWIGILIFKPTLVRLSVRQILISSALGFFGYAVFSTLYFKSLQGLSVSLAALLLFTFPLFVNLGTFVIFRQKLSKKQILSLLLSFFGIVILLWGPVVVESGRSVVYALLAAITYAAYVLASGHYQKNVPAISSSLYVISSAAIALFLFHQPSFSGIASFDQAQIGYILGLAFVCTIMPLTLFLKGLQKLDSATASVVVTVEPVVAAIAGAIILGESLSAMQFVGMVLVIVSLVI